MDLSALSSVSASPLAGTAAGISVERKVLDMALQDGANLSRMIDQAGGVGRNVDSYA